MLVKKVKEFLKANNLINDRYAIVAVSTGVDSTVLLDILYKIGVKVVIAHVNHHKRKESDTEAKFLESYAKEKNIPFEILDYFYNHEGNFHDLAHQARYEFFRKLALKYHTNIIYTAHHADDEIETVLMKILEGSNLYGYGGISKINDNGEFKLIRPLLPFSKELLYSYAKENNLTYFEDSSNSEDDFLRNRIRHKVVSALFEENPNFGENFLYFKDRLAFANDLINQKRDEFIKNNVLRNEFEIKFDIELFKLEDEILKYEILFEILKKYDLSKACIEEILKIIDSNKNNIISNISDICVIKDKNYLIIREEEYQKEEFYLEIKDLGIYNLNDEYEIEFSKLDDLEKKCALSISNVNNIWYNTDMFPFYIRTRVDGDVMLLSKGHKKIKDILIDCKMSKMDKDKILLLEDKNKDIISILGLKKSALLSKATNLDLKIELRRKK